MSTLNPPLGLLLALKWLWRFSFKASAEHLTDEAALQLMSQSQPSGRHTASKGGGHVNNPRQLFTGIQSFPNSLFMHFRHIFLSQKLDFFDIPQ